MTPAEQTAAGLATAIAALRFAEAGAERAVQEIAATTDFLDIARDHAHERWQRIRQTRLALEWEATQVPGTPVTDVAGTGNSGEVTP